MAKQARMSAKDFKQSDLSGDLRTKGAASKRASEPSKSKMGNKKVEYKGHLFDSKWECERFQQLEVLERTGAIEGLRIQVPFELIAGGVYICKYIADFVYQQDGADVVEDAKGNITDMYRLKRRLMLDIFGIKILETYKKQARPPAPKRKKSSKTT